MSLYISSRLKKIGVELGVDPYGTPSASFTHGLLCSSFACNPKTEVKAVPEVRGSFVTKRVTTNAALDYEAALSFPLDTGDNASANIGHFLAAILGVDTVTPIFAFYLHTFTRADVSDPIWFNLYTDKDAVTKQYTGFRAKSLKFTLKAGDGLINVEVGGVVKGESALNNPGTLVFSGAPVITPQQAVLNLGGSPVAFDELTITITRDVQSHRIIGNSRLIDNAFTKSFEIKMEAKGIVFANETVRSAFLAGTSSNMDLTLTDLTTGGILAFSLPGLYYTAFAGPDAKDTDLLMINVSGMVTGDANNFITLQNTRAAAYTA